MERKRRNWAVVFILLVLFSSFLIFYEYSEKEPSSEIVLIERDCLRSILQIGNLSRANSTIVVNHETIAVNIGDENVTLILDNIFPKEKYRISDLYPSFGEGTRISPVLSIPSDLNVQSERTLDTPDSVYLDNNISYRWNASLEPGDAIRTVYENFYNTGDILYKDGKIELPDLEIWKAYQLEENKSKSKFYLNYTMANDGNNLLREASLEVFFPVAEYEGGTMLNVTNTTVSETIEWYHWFGMSDGRGKFVKGIIFVMNETTIETGGHVNVNISIEGYPGKGTIHPFLRVNYEVEMSSPKERIWMPTRLHGDDVKIIRREYKFTCYFLVPDDDFFIMDNGL